MMGHWLHGDGDAAFEAVAAATAAGDAPALFGAVDALARPALAHTLCTVNRFDPERIAVVRLYSSDPIAYPPGGSKEKAGTPWGRHVLLERRVFVGEGTEAIATFFDDHAAIAALGLRSVINVPVVWRERCLGTVNFLMTTDSVHAGHVHAARVAAQLALPGFIAG